MFGLGFGEIMIILVLALVLLGPQRLPDAAKQLGKAMRDFKKATDDVRGQFESAMYEADHDDRPRPVLAPPPAGEVPERWQAGGATPGEVPAATAGNVPGLDAALAEPAPTPAARTAPAGPVPEA